jgi:hypothetical protein
MERDPRQVLVGTLAILAFSLTATNAVDVAQAFPTDSWAVEAGEHLAVLRDFACWDNDGVGKRETFKTVTFSRNVLSAEIFLSGFNMSHTMENGTRQYTQQVDAFIDNIGVPDPDNASVIDRRQVNVKLMYAIADESIRDGDWDTNDASRACIGFTVIARTQ